MPSLSKLFTRKEIDEMREALIAKHGDQCAICKKPRSSFKNKLAVDHRHSDGLIRGLLCFHDNRYKVGRFTLKTILPVVEYLVKYELMGELCQKYGKMLSDMKEDIKSVTLETYVVSTAPLKRKKVKENTKEK